MFPIAVVVIAQDEERNIAQCLRSAIGWAEKIIVVDGGSLDNTVSVASELGATVKHREFDNWANQRNWALTQFEPSDSQWVLFLDADEIATNAFKHEVQDLLMVNGDKLAGIYVRFAFWFLGRELRHGYEAPPVMRLVRRGQVSWCHEGAREYCNVRGETATVEAKLAHYDRKGLSSWVQKQNRNATREAQQMMEAQPVHYDAQIERPVRIWLRHEVYDRLPKLLRPVLYFLYRYILRLGMLDGVSGFAYCFLQGLWYPLLIDLKVIEIERQEVLVVHVE